MTDPYIGEIRQFSFGACPSGWIQCTGEELRIDDFQELYSIIGTTYGGDGRTTFAVPDMRGRTAVNQGPEFLLGSTGGEETVTLDIGTIPAHNHKIQVAATAADNQSFEGNVLAVATTHAYASEAPEAAMASGSLADAGDGKAHENMPPFLVINFCIAYKGTYPPRD